MVFYEAPHKLRKTLRDLYEMLGERRVALVREITKIHEEAIRINLSEAAVMYASKEPKGEYVIVIEGAKEVEKCELTMDEAVKIAKELTEGGISPSEAAKKASKISGISKSDIYRQMMT